MQDPKKRLTAQQILQHDWMRENGTASDKPLDNVILSRMRGFAGMNKLKKEALKVIATGMSPEEIAGLRALFQVPPPKPYPTETGMEGNSGRAPPPPPPKCERCAESIRAAQSMDTDNSGTITAEELREAMKKQGSPLVQEELQRLLESIDVDATGRCAPRAGRKLAAQ